MASRNDYRNEDPLGFTKQTATMLVGLGAGDLIPEFRKRNISTQTLAELDKNDLMVLGADEELADKMLKELRSAARKHHERDMSEELKTDQLIQILKGSNRQLDLIETFMAYTRLKLAEKPPDFIIDKRKNTRASEALCVATACVIADVEELERNFYRLKDELENRDEKRMKRSSILKIVTRIGIISSILLTLRYVLVKVAKS